MELHESHISQSKVRIDALLIENYKLREQSTAGGSIMVLSRLSPFLQIRGIESLRNEIQELWSSKKTLTIPPSALISVADIQRFLVQFSHSYLCNLSPPSWFLQTTTRKFLGREMPSEGYRSKLSGGFSGIESKIMNCETLVFFIIYVFDQGFR